MDMQSGNIVHVDRDKSLENAKDEIGRLRVLIQDICTTYDWCAEDPADRGWSTLDDAIADARANLYEPCP